LIFLLSSIKASESVERFYQARPMADYTEVRAAEKEVAIQLQRAAWQETATATSFSV
jgi:hypothetical protein